MGLTNDVIDGIVAAIAEEFDPIPVFDEAAQQGVMSAPAFFVRSVEPNQTQLVGRRYMRRELIEVTYFPPETEPRRTANDVIDRLLNALEIITVGAGEQLRGSEMESHLDGDSGTVVLTVIYRYPAVRPADDDEDKIDAFESETEVRE